MKEVTYSYYDEYFQEPEHRFKDKIFEINYRPDKGPIGWDSSDSMKSKQELLKRSDTGLVEGESHRLYLQHCTEGTQYCISITMTTSSKNPYITSMTLDCGVKCS